MAQPLLPDFLIEGYRGLRRLEFKKLGNVNLLVGENSVGKTSVLEAVRLYSSQAAIADLADLLRDREEASDPDNWRNFESLFLNRSGSAPIQIGPRESLLRISIQQTVQAVKDGILYYKFVDGDTGELAARFPTLTVEQAGHRIRYAPQESGRPGGFHSQYIDLPEKQSNPPYTFVAAKGLDDAAFAKLWDRIVLTEYEEKLNESLAQIIANIKRVSLVQNGGGSRRAMAKLSSADRPVPLRTLGDGIFRYIGIALALANSKNGFLLVDEFENGLHYKTQEALWKFVIQMARELNVQVFATTHDRDCIGAFGRAAEEDQDSFGVLTKLERVGEDVVAKQLYEDDIVDASQNLVEIR